MGEKAREKWLDKWCLDCGGRKAAGVCIDCLLPLRDPSYVPVSPEDMRADVESWLMVHTPNAYGRPDVDG